MEDEGTEMNIESFLCPITLKVMRDPVNTKYGHLFERSAIEDWIAKKGTCPLTGLPLTKADLFPAISVRNAIQEYHLMVS